MSAMFSRSWRTDRQEPSENVAALIANLEANVGELRTVSHRAFREYIRDQRRARDEAWAPIRHAALNNGAR